MLYTLSVYRNAVTQLTQTETTNERILEERIIDLYQANIYTLLHSPFMFPASI